jgi:hypothetical protein
LFKGRMWPSLKSLYIEVHAADAKHAANDDDQCGQAWDRVHRLMRRIEVNAPGVCHLGVHLGRPASSQEAYAVYYMETTLVECVEQAEHEDKADPLAASWLHHWTQRLVSLDLDWPGFLTGSGGGVAWPHLRAYINHSAPDWPEDAFTLADHVYPSLEALCVSDVQLDSSTRAVALPLRLLCLVQDPNADDLEWPRLALVCPYLEQLYINDRLLTCLETHKLNDKAAVVEQFQSCSPWSQLQVVHAQVVCTPKCPFALYTTGAAWVERLMSRCNRWKLESPTAATVAFAAFLARNKLGAWRAACPR